MIRLTAVSYHNTRPFLRGLAQTGLDRQLDIQLDIPSVSGQRLLSGEVELGLVPVAFLERISARFPEARIVSNWCIGCDGAVDTVALFGACSVDRMKRIYLDYHSATSVRLVQILSREYWKVKPEFVQAEPGFRSQIREQDGGVVIGDRAIGLQEELPFAYDLGEAWKAHTGLPFVFAVWVALKPLDEDFLLRFDEALGLGVRSIPEWVEEESSYVPQGFDLKHYLTERISFELDAPKRKALDLFLEKIGHRKAQHT